MEGMNKELFFGLVRLKRQHHLDEDEYELYFINNTDNPVVIKRKARGSFKTYDEDIVMGTPQDKDVDIRVEARSSVLYCDLSDSGFEGGNEYQAYVEVNGVMKILEFSFSGGAGFMGSYIPVLEKPGRTVYPRIYDSDR